MPGKTDHIPQAIAEPGLIARYTLAFGDQGTGIQLESFHDRDASQAEIDALCDKMVRAGDRVKARHQLPVFRRQLQGVEAKHIENKARKAGVLAQLETMAEARKEKVLQLTVRRDLKQKAAEDAWYESGRKGEFKPQGAAAADLSRLNAEISQLEQNQTKDNNEAQAQLSVLDNELKEGDRAISQMQALIAEAEALARGEDVSGVVEE